MSDRRRWQPAISAVLTVAASRSASARTKCSDDISFQVATRRDRLRARAVGLGQVDAAALHQLARAAGRGTDLSQRRADRRDSGRRGDERPRAVRMRTRIGMVFQHFALWPHLTVLQNVMEAPVQVQRRPKAEVRDEALALLAKVGLCRQARRVSRQAFGRPEAARRHRARARHASGPAAVRRADQRARSRAGRRGAGRDARACARRHDHGRRHARDGLCARGREAASSSSIAGASSRPARPDKFFAATRRPSARASSCSAMPAAARGRQQQSTANIRLRHNP